MEKSIEMVNNPIRNNNIFKKIIEDDEYYKIVLRNKDHKYKKIYRMIHLFLIEVNNSNITIDDIVLNKFKLIDSFYNSIYTERDFTSDILDKEYEYNDIMYDLNNRLSKLISSEELYEDNSIYSLIRKVSSEKYLFNLNKEFEQYHGNLISNEVNAVSVISPSQTISRFNERGQRGELGAGYHADNYNEIVTSIYGREFNLGISGQDIIIRYMNSTYKEIQTLTVVLDIPMPINSSQKVSLINLKKEIKKYENDNNISIKIKAMIVDYNIGPLNKAYDNRRELDDVDFDELLELLTIRDDIEYKYEEKYLVGYTNIENHYNDVINFKKYLRR